MLTCTSTSPADSCGMEICLTMAASLKLSPILTPHTARYVVGTARSSTCSVRKSCAMRLCEIANACAQFRRAAARRFSPAACPAACRAPPEVRNSTRRILGPGDCTELVSLSHQFFTPQYMCSPVFLSCLWGCGRQRCRGIACIRPSDPRPKIPEKN